MHFLKMFFIYFPNNENLLGWLNTKNSLGTNQRILLLEWKFHQTTVDFTLCLLKRAE